MNRNHSSTAADTTLTSGVSSANTAIDVAATTGFPAPPFVLALDAGAASQELVLVTAVGGLTLTVTRGYDSTVAAAHNAGAVVSHSHAAIDFRETGQHIDATAAHGATGAVVGTTNTQTLTNKTLTAPALTDPTASGSLTGFGGAWTAWTPTVTAATGTFTTVSGAGRYSQVGKVVTFSVTITITTVGTASGAIIFTLPVTAAAGGAAAGAGLETANTGKMVSVFLASTTTAQVSYYDNTTAIAAGNSVRVYGTYEAA